ncbi:MAG TPA: hypothetical protein VEJ63_02385 [Planctomycetota bacterium]|nr:hypothetical protein [Planctomycetota bacterium]
MDVIGNASVAMTFTTGIARDLGQIRMQFDADRLFQMGLASFGAEDDMDDNEAERLRPSSLKL